MSSHTYHSMERKNIFYTFSMDFYSFKRGGAKKHGLEVNDKNRCNIILMFRKVLTQNPQQLKSCQ